MDQSISLEHLCPLSSMSFENVQDCYLHLNPLKGNQGILMEFPALAVQDEFQHLMQAFPDCQDPVDHLYSVLQVRTRESVLSDLEGCCVTEMYEPNVFRSNGEKWNDDPYEFDFVPLGNMDVEDNNYQISIFHELYLVPEPCKRYTMPVCEDWNQMCELEKTDYWASMILKCIKHHDKLYRSEENATPMEHLTSVDSDVVLMTE